MPFICSICGEESTRICARCTKDVCDNHLCEKCLRCSDCCECEVTLSEPVRTVVHPPAPESAPAPEAEVEPVPEPEPEPMPAALMAEPELIAPDLLPEPETGPEDTGTVPPPLGTGPLP
jgi:hypothetical protein